MGRIVGTSEKTSSRLLRSETGLSFVQWRQRLQLVLAIRYLKWVPPFSRSPKQWGTSNERICDHV